MFEISISDSLQKLSFVYVAKALLACVISSREVQFPVVRFNVQLQCGKFQIPSSISFDFWMVLWLRCH